MLNWNAVPIPIARSRGGVLATTDPRNNLLSASIAPWPPAEIVQKLYRSNQQKAFSGADLDLAISGLGYYCDLQSLRSEDAITWSVFGPVAYAGPSVRLTYVRDLLDLIGVEPGPFGSADVWLWRRVPHPDTLVSGGPEIDFGVQTDSLVLFGEAKWLSGVGRGQGKARNKDQMTLRREFFQKYGARMYGPGKRFVVLGVSLEGDLCETSDEPLSDGCALSERCITWKDVCGLASHPAHEELRRYLEWKVEYS